MLKIRLTRKGKKNKAFYRLVVAEHTSPIKGRFLEVLGSLNPHSKEKSFKEEKIKYWIGKGAQCSETAHNLLVSAGIITGKKRAIKMKKKEDEKPVSDVKLTEGETKKPEKKTVEEGSENKAEDAKTEVASVAEIKSAEGETSPADAKEQKASIKKTDMEDKSRGSAEKTEAKTSETSAEDAQ